LKAAECEKIKSQIDELAKKYSQLMETSQFHEANEISHQMADLEKVTIKKVLLF
jgi:excinuclease UvrABC nuclease subunit